MNQTEANNNVSNWKQPTAAKPQKAKAAGKSQVPVGGRTTRHLEKSRPLPRYKNALAVGTTHKPLEQPG